MFVPLHDTNPLKRIDFQYVTVALILLNVAIFVVFQTGWVVPLDEENTAAFAVIPAKLMEGGPDAGTVYWRQWSWVWDASSGRHDLTVRATNGDGEVQTDKRAEPFPGGASGYHSIVVIIS